MRILRFEIGVDCELQGFWNIYVYIFPLVCIPYDKITSWIRLDDCYLKLVSAEMFGL